MGTIAVETRRLWQVWRYRLDVEDGTETTAKVVRGGFLGLAMAERHRDGYVQALAEVAWDEYDVNALVNPAGEVWQFAVSSYRETRCIRCQDWTREDDSVCSACKGELADGAPLSLNKENTPMYCLETTLRLDATTEERDIALQASSVVFPTIDAAYEAGMNLWNGPEGVRQGYSNVAVIPADLDSHEEPKNVPSPA
jgi:choline dehydrogenase-like flavoprotein